MNQHQQGHERSRARKNKCHVSCKGLRIICHLLLGWEELRNSLPDGSSASACGEAEDGIGPPSGILLVVDDIGNGAVNVDSRHTLPKPVALHHRGWDGPDLYVIKD